MCVLLINLKCKTVKSKFSFSHSTPRSRLAFWMCPPRWPLPCTVQTALGRTLDSRLRSLCVKGNGDEWRQFWWMKFVNEMDHVFGDFTWNQKAGILGRIESDVSGLWRRISSAIRWCHFPVLVWIQFGPFRFVSSWIHQNLICTNWIFSQI